MFDGLKLRCPALDPARWLHCPELVENGFPLAVIEPTGEIQDKPRTATYNGLTFAVKSSVITDYRLTVSGSIHKYYNGGQTNANRFPLTDVKMCINDLQSRFGIEPETTLLEGVEIGVNLPLPFSPSRVIRSAVAYNGLPYHSLSPKRTGQTGKICCLAQYEIKLYDKGKQSDCQRANLLRVEVRVKKMQYLEPYGITTLADLTNPAKAARLVEVIANAIAGTVFIDALAAVELLTPAERSTFYRLRDADEWSSTNLSRRMRSYYRQQLPDLLHKCHAFDYQTALHNWLVAEWNALVSAPCDNLLTAPPEPDSTPNEAPNDVTFLPLECVGKTVTPTLEREPIYFLAEIEQRVCLTCGKPLSGQRLTSRFCSQKYNGPKAARRCRNQNSNHRRTKRNRIMRAKERNQFLQITYTANGHTYTDRLHSSEVAVSREWLDQVISVEVLSACRDAQTSGPNCYGHCPCQPETLTGQPARDRLTDLTTANRPELLKPTLNTV